METKQEENPERQEDANSPLSQEARQDMMFNMNISGIPEHMRDGLYLYITHGIEPGSFLMAVLQNDLMEAAGRADNSNLSRLHNYCQFLYNYAPSGCKGSPLAVMAWIKHGGLSGRK